MKKLTLQTALSCFVLLLFITSCANNGSKMPVTTIQSSSSGTPSVKIEYSGTIKLSDDKTAFKSISPNGFLNYKNGKKKLVVQSDSEGRLAFSINNNEQKFTLDASEKTVVAEVIKDMQANGAKFK